MWTRFVRWLKKLLTDKEPTPTPDPVPVPSEEYSYDTGEYVERVVDINGGSWTAEVYAPESGRSTDWNKMEMFSVFNGEYHQKQNNIYATLWYKCKFCSGSTCKEPRYNLKWDQWRTVMVTWDAAKCVTSIDGTVVKVEATTAWNPALVTKAQYGRGAIYPGCRARNIKWT